MTIADSLEAIDERFDDRSLERISLDIEFDSDTEGVTVTSDGGLAKDDVEAMIDDRLSDLEENVDKLVEMWESEGNGSETTVSDMGDDPGHTSGGGKDRSSDGVAGIRDKDLGIEIRYPNEDRHVNSISVERAYPVVKAFHENASSDEPLPVQSIKHSVDFSVSASMPVLYEAGVVDRVKIHTDYSNRPLYCYWVTDLGADWLSRAEQRYSELPGAATVRPPEEVRLRDNNW